MAGAGRRGTAFHRGAAAVIGAAAALALSACSGAAAPAPAPARGAAAVRVLPQRILQAPRSVLAATLPPPGGSIWALAGPVSAGLFAVDPATGRVIASFSVSGAARSVAVSASGLLGLALGSGRAGALQVLDGRTRRVLRSVPLPAPAADVVAGAQGSTFYVLTRSAATASVEVVNGRAGRVTGTVPVPSDAVSIVPDTRAAALYVLQRAGLVDQIGLADGKVAARFTVGDTGQSIALSPDGRTLYVLKNAGPAANIAVVDVDTEAVRRVLPAPQHCRQVLVSPDGGRLYEVVGTAGYGNIQVFAA